MGDVCLAPTRFASHFPFLSFSAVITFLVPAHGFWAGLDPSIALGMLRVLPYGPTAGPRHHGPKEQTPCAAHIQAANLPVNAALSHSWHFQVRWDVGPTA